MAFLIFIILLSVLVLVHELGHFLAAKKLGVATEEFGLGLPPRLKKLFHWRGTDFTLNALPLGGFVRMRGEDANPDSPSAFGQPSALEAKGFFFAQKPWKRAVILVSGVLMNLLLGIAAFTAVFTALGIPRQSDKVIIEAVLPGSPAEKADLAPKDVVEEIEIPPGTVSVRNSDQFVEIIGQYRGREITLIVNREGNQLRRLVTPRVADQTPANEGAMGVVVSSVEFVHYPWWQMPARASVVGVKEAIAWADSIIAGLAGMVVMLFRGVVPTDIAGPIGIAKLTSEAASRGWIPVFQLAGILSINLAIVNILPIPALDGGRLMFVIIEKIRGRPVHPHRERWAHLVGYAFLIALIILITLQDVLRLIS